MLNSNEYNEKVNGDEWLILGSIPGSLWCSFFRNTRSNFDYLNKIINKITNVNNFACMFRCFPDEFILNYI